MKVDICDKTRRKRQEDRGGRAPLFFAESWVIASVALAGQQGVVNYIDKHMMCCGLLIGQAFSQLALEKFFFFGGGTRCVCVAEVEVCVYPLCCTVVLCL
jgi:hypothetical protein